MNFPPLRDPSALPTGTFGLPEDPVPAEHDEDDEPLLLDDPIDTAVLVELADLPDDSRAVTDVSDVSDAVLPAPPGRSRPAVEASPVTRPIASGGAAAADEPIPMLTEVVQVPRYDTEDIPESFAEVDWGDLAQKVRENVLERLLRRSDALLDSQIQATLTPVLERAVETVAQEMHDAMTRMIRDTVARAVTEELTRLHAEIARRNRSKRTE